MRSLILREQISSKTRASFLIALLFVTVLQMALKYGMSEPPEDARTSHATSDAALLTSLHPLISALRESRPSAKQTIPSEAGRTRSTEQDLVLTQQQRSLHIVYRLSRFNGTGRGLSKVSNVIVSCIGIIGMFSAILGAFIGPWLAEAIDDPGDDERFSFWVAEEDDDANNERICGLLREERYALYRLLDVP